MGSSAGLATVGHVAVRLGAFHSPSGLSTTPRGPPPSLRLRSRKRLMSVTRASRARRAPQGDRAPALPRGRSDSPPTRSSAKRRAILPDAHATPAWAHNARSRRKMTNETVVSAQSPAALGSSRDGGTSANAPQSMRSRAKTPIHCGLHIPRLMGRITFQPISDPPFTRRRVPVM